MLAIAFDMLDGRVARITKTTSDFGIQLDSLSDLISFGVAPSVMMYQLVLNSMGKIGAAIAVLFVVCSALRLAKFNVIAKNGVVCSVFVGLPTPASAGLLTSFVLSYELFSCGQPLMFKTIPVLARNMPLFLSIVPVVIVVLSLLMVSNVPYISFKKLKFSHYKLFGFLVLGLLFVCLIFRFVQNIIFMLFLLYVLSGIFGYITGKPWKILKEAYLKKAGGNNEN